MACGYSKLEALDADYNAKIRFQIGPSYPEKMINKYQNLAFWLDKPFFGLFWAFSLARKLGIEHWIFAL